MCADPALGGSQYARLFPLARRSAFSRARQDRLALVGLVFGWAGVVLMLV